jgi:hypothetical protein
MKAAGADMDNLKKLNEQALNVVLPVAKSLTPVDDENGGELKASVRGSATKTAATIRAGYKKLPYAGVIHYGWPTGKTDILGRPKRLNAQPWLAEAAKQTEPQWVDNYFDGLMEVINSVQGE